MSDASPAKMADLKTRIVSALILAAAILFITWWGGLPFSLTWAAAAIVVMIEFFRTIGTYDKWIALAGGTALAVLALLAPSVMGPSHFSLTGSVFPYLFVILALGTVTVIALARSGKKLWAAIGFLYASVLAFTPPFLRADPFEGLFILLAIYGLVWGTDIGAYFFGRLIGGPKLWPRVSPKKTWSGLLGGMLCGVLLAWIFMSAHDMLFRVKDLPTPGWGWRIQLSIFLAVTAALTQLGDLMESAWKRHFDVKDASGLIPGHGGLMDRLDGFWAACIVMLLAYGIVYGFS